MNTNKAIVNKAGAITTSVVSSGLLQPYQAKKFLQQTFDATPLMQAIRHEVRTEKSGEIDKIGIGKRKLRGKMENVDDGYRAGFRKMYRMKCTILFRDWNMQRLLRTPMQLSMTASIHGSCIRRWNSKR